MNKSLEELLKEPEILFVTKKGLVVRLNQSELRVSDRAGKGVRAISLDEGDSLVASKYVYDFDNIRISTKNGKCISFPVSKVRIIGKGSRGVKGILLDVGDEVVAII